MLDTDVADKPIRIFHGTPDDYNPVAPCKRIVERLRGAGHDVVVCTENLICID